MKQNDRRLLAPVLVAVVASHLDPLVMGSTIDHVDVIGDGAAATDRLCGYTLDGAINLICTVSRPPESIGIQRPLGGNIRRKRHDAEKAIVFAVFDSFYN